MRPTTLTPRATTITLVTETELRRALAAAGCRDVDTTVEFARDHGVNIVVGGRTLRMVEAGEGEREVGQRA